MTVPPSPSPGADATRRARFTDLRATGDPALRDELVHEHLSLARSLARRFANRGVPLDDLVQVASLGLVQAVDRYDPDAPATFVTFATPTILGEIKRHFRDRSWGLRVPRRLQELHLELNGVVATLSQQLGRSPTVPELAAATRVSDEEIIEAIEAGRAYHLSSLDVSTSTGSTRPVERALLAEDPRLQDAATRLMIEQALGSLPPREQLLMRLRYWDRLSQDAIARRLGISQMHVSRLLSRSIATLGDLLDVPDDEG